MDHIKKIKLETNLQQRALIRVAANIWLSRPMIAEICDFFSKNNINYKSPGYDKIKIKMREWLTDIFKQVDSMELPYVIKSDLLHVMKPVGENLLDYLRRTSTKWSEPLYKEPLFPGLDVYYKHIEFDCIGRVDEVKTFLNIYNASENISLLFLFFEACTYCLEDVIHSIWNKCSKGIKLNIKQTVSVSLGFQGYNIHKIQQYWMQFFDKKQLKLPYKITEIDALKYCFQTANNVGVKYFINKISQNDTNILSFYKKNVPLGEQLLIFEESPWKYFFLLNLEYSDSNYWMIETIVKRIVDDYNFYKKIVYTDLWMLLEIWKKCPDNLEESIVEICWSIEKPIIFKLQAVILVTSVIGNTDRVNKLRPEICKGFEIHCNELIDEQKYEVVYLYLKNILQNDEERKPYQELLQSGSHKKVLFGSTSCEM